MWRVNSTENTITERAGNTESSTRLDYLDALRGLAVLGVICLHCAYAVEGEFRGRLFAMAGGAGVQLFFMVSAFTIFLTLERARARTPHVAKAFFIRRFFRILPMFLVGLVIYTFVHSREPVLDSIKPGVFDYLLTILCLHGWAPVTQNLLVPGGWTIGIEASFYLVAPFLFSWIKNRRRALALVLLAAVGSKVCNFGMMYLYHHHVIFGGVAEPIMQNFAYRWFPNQLSIFATGILTYFIVRGLPADFSSRNLGWMFLAVAAILLHASVGMGSYGFLPQHFHFALGFLFLFVALKCHPSRLLVNGFTRFLGKISYSGYLLHFGMLVLTQEMGRAWFGNFGTNYGARFGFLFATTIALTMLAAWVTYKLVEQPFISFASKWAKQIENQPS